MTGNVLLSGQINDGLLLVRPFRLLSHRGLFKICNQRCPEKFYSHVGDQVKKFDLVLLKITFSFLLILSCLEDNLQLLPEPTTCDKMAWVLRVWAKTCWRLLDWLLPLDMAVGNGNITWDAYQVTENRLQLNLKAINHEFWRCLKQ